MTRTEMEMTRLGYIAEDTRETLREAEDRAETIRNCGQGEDVVVRKSADGFTVWVESRKTYEKRMWAWS